MPSDPLAMAVYRMRRDAIQAALAAGEITQTHASALYRALVTRLLTMRGQRRSLKK
jgi:hypothetical protein